MAKFVVPRNVQALLQLGQRIYQKHQADGANSPLALQSDYDWSLHGPNLAQALQFHDQAEDLRRQMEAAYEQRDRLMGNIDEAVKSSRDLLKGVYRNQPHKLGDWGFEVNE